MVCKLRWAAVTGLLLLANIASALDAMTADDLTRACQRLLDGGNDVQCVAYIQGYIAGAEQTTFGEQSSQQDSSDFFQRAVRTRLGETTQINAQGHVYCIPAEESFRAFADKVVTVGEEANITAEEIMEAVLKQHFPCEA
ncbi:Rap1a/Tai family immunity protein [Pseudomaricurvus sp.]|uniref:Rap1a/Tai family immunity protein n=1 Tax=Pseudomaricurvus sp. TaxID=2004510 RepID=UPI003F6B208C